MRYLGLIVLFVVMALSVNLPLYASDEVATYQVCLAKFQSSKQANIQACIASCDGAECRRSCDTSDIDKDAIATCKKELASLQGPPTPLPKSVPLPPERPADSADNDIPSDPGTGDTIKGRAIPIAPPSANNNTPLPPTGRPKSSTAAAKANSSSSDDSDDDNTDDSATPAKSSGKKSSTASDTAGTSGSKSTSGTKSDSNNTSSSKGSTSDDSSTAQSQADSDVSICSQWQNRAQACCNNPTACLSTNDQSKLRQLAQLQNSSNTGDANGLTATCQQMQQTGDDGSSVNRSLAAACTTNQTTCSSSCAQLQQKYYNLMNSCNSSDCQNYSIYSSAYSRLTSGRSSCDNLSARGDALSMQGLQANTSAYSQYCNGMSSASPQSASGAPSAASTATTAAASTNCLTNPSAAGCTAAASTATQIAINRGQGGYTVASKAANKFNLGDNADQTAGSSGFTPQPSSTGKPGSATVVPNGGGGGIPGGGGGGGQASGGGGSRATAGSPGFSTDIDRGLRSGGGYSAAGGPPNQANNDGRSPASASGGGNPLVGADLRQFLPGGSRDPSRRLAGSVGGSQINLKEEDIWRRISNKIQEKCKLGELWNCQ